MAKEKLPNEIRLHIVQALACFDAPAVIVASIKREFGKVISPQAIEAYDPTKRAGRNGAEKWKEMFHATRKAYLEETSGIAISHRSVRLRALQRMFERSEEMRNYAQAAQMLEQAAKEMGDLYTNRHRLEHTGKGGETLKVVFETIYEPHPDRE